MSCVVVLKDSRERSLRAGDPTKEDKKEEQHDVENDLEGYTASLGTTNMNLSFAGCGFLGIYHVGVAVCFKKYAPHLLLNKISGASAGAIAACCLLCDLPLGE